MAEPNTIMNGGPDRSVTDSPERIFEALFRVHDMRFEVCLPAIVRDYNRNSHLALVQPLVNMVSSEGEQLERAPILVPVRRVMYGGFMVDFPLNIGDTGWVIAGDRDSENALLANSGNVTSSSNPNEGGQRPATKLLHKYRFGFFIPDRWGTINLSTKDGDPNYMEGQNVDGANVDYKDKAVIRSQNGKTKIVLTQDGYATISLDGNLSINSQVAIDGNVSITGNITAGGDMSATGGISAGGSIHSSSEISAEGKVISDKDVIVNTGDSEGVSVKLHTHMFPHTHTTPAGDTTSQSTETTHEPDKGSFAEKEITVNLTIENSSSYDLVGVRYDRFERTTTSATEDATTVPDIAQSNSRQITFKIKKLSGSSFSNDPYFRLLLYMKSGNAWYSKSKSSVRGSSAYASGTTVTKENGTDAGSTYAFLFSLDFSRYLSGTPYQITDIDMTMNISAMTSGYGTITQPTYPQRIVYYDNIFVCGWTISQ